MSTHRFWSFDGDCRETHATEAEARATCENALDHYRDMAPEGWDEEVDQIMWGEIRERVVVTERKTLAEYDAEGDEAMVSLMKAEGWECTENRALKPIGEGC
jgi:hypothetical protein